MTEEKKLWQKGGGWLLEVPERVYTPEDFDESVKEIARTTRTFVEREVLPLLERMEHGELARRGSSGFWPLTFPRSTAAWTCPR